MTFNFNNLETNPSRLVIAVGGTIGLCILGDSFLYGILPLEAQNLGIALPLVGILLSANRLIRLLSNTWTSTIFERLGPRLPFIASTILALITTTVYGLGWGFIAFLFARASWGIAWSALRQGGYQAIWAGDARSRGKLTGLLWGMVRLGSALSVLIGGYLRDQFGYATAILAVIGTTAFAIPLAVSIRWHEPAHLPLVPRQSLVEGWRTVLQNKRDLALLNTGIVGAVFEGVVISSMSLFLANHLGTGELLPGSGVRVGTVAGLMLAVRWVSDLLLGSIFGVLSDRIGQPRMMVILSVALTLAMILMIQLSGVLLVIFLALVLISSGGLYVTLTAVVSGASLHSERPHLFVGVYATATDAGSSIGPLIAYAVGSVLNFDLLYVLMSTGLMVAILQFWKSK